MREPRMRRRRVNRGQALVELMLFFPLLVFMVVGSTDISALLDDHLNIIYAARTGARVGSVMGTNQYADCAVIGAVQAALANNQNVTLNRIIIYPASYSTSTNGAYTGGAADIYPGSAMCNSTSPNSGTISVAPIQATWQPAVRNVTPFTENSLGVELDYTYAFQFNPLGMGSFNSTDFGVMPLEVIINQNASPTPTP